MGRQLALAIFIEMYTAGCGRPTTQAETTPIVASPNEVTSTACGEYEGGLVGNWVGCVSMGRQGRVGPSTLDVGSPFTQTSELACGLPVNIWGRTFEVTCDHAPSRAGYPPETTIGLRNQHQSIELITVPDVFLATRWWAEFDEGADRVDFTFRFHKLD